MVEDVAGGRERGGGGGGGKVKRILDVGNPSATVVFNYMHQ